MTSHKDEFEESLSRDKTFSDKAKELLKGVGDKTRNVTGTLSGTDIEHKVAEYSELYTQVLLGLHKDVETQESRIEVLESKTGSTDQQGVQNPHINELRRQVASLRHVRIIAIVALIVALISAGIAVWSAL